MLIYTIRSYITYFIILLSANCFQAHAQSKELRFKHLSFKEGLTQSPVTAMHQDKKGFVWIGNWKGLIRYDGYEFKHYLHQDEQANSIGKGRVNVLFEDSKGSLWVGTANGLSRYRSDIEGFDYFGSNQLKGGKNYISGILQDVKGDIWVATFAGVFKVDTLNYRLTETPLYKGTAYTLQLDETGSIWVGTKTGVRKFNPQQGQEEEIPQDLKNHRLLSQSKILFIRQNAMSGYWFGTEEDGLVNYQPESGLLQTFTEQNSALLSNMIKDMAFDQAHNLWIGTRGGMNVYNLSEGRFNYYKHHEDEPYSLFDNSVWSVMIDRDQHLWVGTFSGAISYATPNNLNFKNIGGNGIADNGFENRIIHALVPDQKNGLWVATFGGGLHHLDTTQTKISHFAIPAANRVLASQHIKSMAADIDGKLWLGTLNGLFTFEPYTHRFSHYPLSFPDGKLSAHLINCLLPTDKGLWAGANGGGLFFIPNDGTEPAHYVHQREGKHSLSDDFVNVLLADGENGMWIGTQNGLDYFDYGLHRITQSFRKNDQHQLLSNDIQTLFYDSEHRLWVGTEGGGLYYFDSSTAQFFALDRDLGLTNHAIHRILEDQNANLWVSTDNGLFMIHFKRFQTPFRQADVQINHYTSQHGLSGNMYMANAGYADSNGELYFGGMNGLTHFSPDKLYQHNKAPNVVLTDFMIRNQPVVIDPEGQSAALKQSITESKHIILAYHENYISIKYAGINYVNTENNQYAYRLEGLANDYNWHYVGKERIANYTNLDPGKYTFKVMAANSDGLWSKMPTTLQLTVLPPLWKTWWAYTLYVSVGAFLMIWILRYIRGKELLKRDLLHEHLKLEFFTNVSHEIRTPLTLLLAPLDRLTKRDISDPQIKKTLLLMNNNAKRLKNLVNELLDFRKIDHGKMKLYYTKIEVSELLYQAYLPFIGMAEQKNVRFYIENAEEPLCLYMDRDQMDKVFSNLFSNAFKFVPTGGTIRVKVERIMDKGNPVVNIRISDSGPGIPEDEQRYVFDLFWQSSTEKSMHRGTGIGLALCKKIVELHKGSITYDRRLGMSQFTIALPDNLQGIAAEDILPERVMDMMDIPIERHEGGGIQQDRRTILLVDDHPDMCYFLQEILQGYYRVVVAYDGEEAWEKILGTMPDLIISDVMMPKINGLALCERIKEDEQTNHIPIMLLTAKTADIHKIEGLSSGADVYLTKPFSVDILLLHVQNILVSKDALRKKYSQQLILEPLAIATDTKEAHFLQKLLGIIESNIEDAAFGVPELAREIGMSKSVLYNKMQAITDLSVANFIKSIRLHKAAIYLREGRCSVAEVAFSVGFNDRKYFSKEFRKQFNQSPSIYTANLQKEPLVKF